MTTSITAVIENPITLEEVSKVLCHAKLGKAVGTDDIPTEVLQNETAKHFLYVLFYNCYEHNIISTTWLRGIINPVPKDNTLNPRDPLNYRGITLACSMYKLYCNILNSHLAKWAVVNGLIVDGQNGFRPGRSCIDQIRTPTNIVETRKNMKKSTFTAFIDFSKAFDRINQNLLWHKLQHLGIPDKLFSTLQCIYGHVQYCVRINGVRTDWFNVSSGLKQGCLLSPILFNLYINDLVLLLNNAGHGVDLDGVKVNVLLYADDLFFVANCEQDFQAMLDILHQWCLTCCMAVNSKKSLIVHFLPVSMARSIFIFHIWDDPIHYVNKYKYLGLLIDKHLDYQYTATMVTNAAGHALGVLIAKVKSYGAVSYDCYTKLYNALVQPIIDYGASIWGTKEYTCLAAVQHRACRFFIGVGKYTPNFAVQGDMGWPLPGK